MGSDIQTVRGMRDLIGADALLQRKVEDAFRNAADTYGYLPLYTPAVESFDLFKVKGGAGEAIKEEIYYFKDKSERELALRFEFTASLARVAATNQLKMPFKRYQIGEVYRYDRPQAKRYRAFYQADFDVLGVKGIEAELEVMSIIRDSFKELNLTPRVVFNSRKLLQALLENFAKGREVDAMRTIDKLDKLSVAEVKKELEGKGIPTEIVDIVQRNSLTEVAALPTVKGSEGLAEVTTFLDACTKNGINFVELNIGLARGLEYYTGIVFEVKLDSGPSVGGGGRYDRLVGLYGGQETPAVGLGFGVSRIFDILKEKGEKVALKGMFLCGADTPYSVLAPIGQTLRNAGIALEMDLVGKGIGKSFEYAQKKGYVFVGIIGENEIKSNTITLKNLDSGEQQVIALKDTQKIKELLATTQATNKTTPTTTSSQASPNVSGKKK